jgi:Dna[CI] antecedent, DciA
VAQYSIGEAIQMMIKSSNWRNRYLQSRIKEDWEQIMGKTIAKYTQDVKYVDGTLVIKTVVGPLKNELTLNKNLIKERFNEHLKETVIKEVLVVS